MVACVALCLALLLFLTAQANAALYIGTDSIARANLDGSLFESDFIGTGGGSVCAIAVDSSHIYWADSYDDTIGRASLDGTTVEDVFIRLAAGTLPCGLAVDSKYIYWPSMGTDTIGRARIDGSQVDESFIPTVQHPCAVAINQTGIYWASDDENEIWRTDIEGVNGPEIVIDEDATDSCGLALVGPHLFWVESINDTIGRANLDGSEPLPAFVTGGHYPVSLVTQGRQLYWVNAGRGFESIGRADVDGANVNQMLIGGLSHPYALAADSVQTAPRPPVIPQAPSTLKLGRLQRQQDGSVLFPVDLLGEGWLEADVQGARLRIQPEGVAAPAMLGPSRKWLKITPTTKRGGGSRCVLRAIRRGARVKLTLRLRFSERGKTPLAKRRSFLLFNPRQVARATRKKGGRPVRCPH